MTPHQMPQDHCIAKLYLFAADIKTGRCSSETDVVISPNGLACALRDVGRGYAQAAVSAGNACRGADAIAPWAAAYEVPNDYCLLALPDGWTSIDFLAFPLDSRMGEHAWKWQMMARAESDGEFPGWAPAGILHHDRCEGIYYLPHGSGLGDRVDLPRALASLTTRKLVDGSAWGDLKEFVSEQQDQSHSGAVRERMEMA